MGPDRLGPHRPDGAGSTGAASTSGAGSTGAASTYCRIGVRAGGVWGRIDLWPVIYGRSGPTTPPSPSRCGPSRSGPSYTIRPQYPSGPRTYPAPGRSVPHITKHKICTSIYQPCPVRPHYSCNRRSIRPHVVYTYSWSGPMQLSMKNAPLYLRFVQAMSHAKQGHRSTQ